MTNEEVKAAKRAYYHAHKVEIRQKRKLRYKANPSQQIEATRLWRAKNPEKVKSYGVRTSRRARLKYNYGLTMAEWNVMFDAQGCVCAICHCTTPRSVYAWHTDHDHDTGRIRGILCAHCNTGLGRFEDNPDRLIAAAAYLRSTSDEAWKWKPKAQA